MPTDPKRFWPKVSKTDGCWIHSGSVGTHGYAQYGYGTLAHRVSWQLAYGPIPEDRFVLHKCNVKRCVRPDHLYLGTHEDNMDDVARGRYHPKRKLTTEEVEMIRASVRPLRQMARDLNVSQKTIQNVVRHKVYRYG